jgi:lysophospholipase L1-like esterase
MRAVRTAAPSASALGYSEGLADAVASSGLALNALLAPRAGLPRLAAALEGASLDRSEPLRVCYLGGSVTEQRNGYRPRVTKWLEVLGARGGVRVEEVPAFCGNCGSKVLAFMVADWVVSRRPHLVFVELAINDGDTLLETEDSEGVGSALEGIVRHVRDALPRCELCLLYMFVRDDLPLHQRTGSKAWTENDEPSAAIMYHETVPRLHDRVAERYGVPSVRLAPLMSRLASDERQLVFRDDCHLSDAGAALTAAAVCAAVDSMRCGSGGGGGGGGGGGACGGGTSGSGGSGTLMAVSHPSAPFGGVTCALPAPVFTRPWGRGHVEPVTPQQLSFFYRAAPPTDEVGKALMMARLAERHTIVDMDPLDNAQRKAWWLLYSGDRAELRFRGTRLGILTMIGPDAGTISCEITHVATGQRVRCRKVLLDQTRLIASDCA